MLLKLALLFIGLPFLEIVILVKLGEAIGFVNTILIVIVTGFTGAILARWQGTKVWQEIALELQQGRMPAESLVDGLLIFAAGLVLITPGLITDIIGFLLLIPVTRLFFKRWLRRKFEEMSAHGDSQMVIFLK